MSRPTPPAGQPEPAGPASTEPASTEPASTEPASTEPASTGWAARRQAGARRAGRPVRALRAVPHLGTWAGLALTCLGALLLAIAWGRTAALTNVALQLPYLISAGCTGLGCIAVGITVLNLSAKHQDAAERARQSAELRALLGALRTALATEPAPLPDQAHR